MIFPPSDYKYFSFLQVYKTLFLCLTFNQIGQTANISTYQSTTVCTFGKSNNFTYRFFSAIIWEMLMMGVDFGLFLEGGRGPLRGTMTTSLGGPDECCTVCCCCSLWSIAGTTLRGRLERSTKKVSWSSWVSSSVELCKMISWE